MNEVNLINEIKKLKPESKILITSFKFNPKFFENFIFPRFINRTFPLIFIDYSEYQSKIHDFKMSKSAETKYFIESIKCKKIFHPKLFLSLYKNVLNMWIGSNNLTESGYCYNAELVNPISINIDDPIDLDLIFDIHNFIKELSTLSKSEPHKRELAKILKKLPVKNSFENRYRWILNNISKPFLHQIKDIIKEKITKIHVISPFFAQDGEFYQKILEICEKLHIIIQQNNNNLPIDVMNVRDNITYSEMILGKNRQLHAKLVFFETESNNYILSGSANFTRTAFLSQNNVELVVLSKTKKRFYEITEGIKIRNINLSNIKNSPELPSTDKLYTYEYNILEAALKDNILRLKLNKEFSKNKVKLILGKHEKEYNIEPDKNIIEFKIPEDLVNIFKRSVVVRIEYKDNGINKQSDSKLVHFKHIFLTIHNELNMLGINTSNWLVSIIFKLLKMPAFYYPIVEVWNPDDVDDIDDIIPRIKNKLKYKPPENEKMFINNLINKHHKRIVNAIKKRKIEKPVNIIKTFIFLSNLVIGSIVEGINYFSKLGIVRDLIEEIFLSERNYIDSIRKDVQKSIIRKTYLKYHVGLLTYLLNNLFSNKLKNDPSIIHVKVRFDVVTTSLLQKLILIDNEQFESKKFKELFYDYGHFNENIFKFDPVKFCKFLNRFMNQAYNNPSKSQDDFKKLRKLRMLEINFEIDN